MAYLESAVQSKGEYIQNPTGGYYVRLIVTPSEILNTFEEVHAFEQKVLTDGWEGAMLRHPFKPYKFGRSTNRGGELVKLKRFEDAEAIVTGFDPWERNDNDPTTDVRGYTVRTSHQDGKVPLEMLGALHVELATDRSVKFKIGVMRGVTHEERCRLWVNRAALIGRICKFKHQGYGGGYDVPRCPVFLNWRTPSEF